MIIDFHAHVYPEKVADRTIERLTACAGVTAHTNGRLNDTLDRLPDWGIDKIIALNIATKPSQMTNVNNFARECCSDRVIAFGSVFPGDPGALDELDRIKELGLHGVKLHPDYQGYMAMDQDAFPVYKRLEELGLPVVFHSGFDPVSPFVIHTPPSAIAQIQAAFPSLTIIAAHMGGFMMWDDVEKHLVGTNVWLDTSLACTLMERSQYRRIINNHRRILFGSDLPWNDPARELAFLRSLELPAEHERAILYNNAVELLEI